jgi:hypothetical protein
MPPRTPTKKTSERSERSFKYGIGSDPKEFTGRYMINQDAHPQDAAKKVASTLFGRFGNSPPSSIKFVLKESTAGSDKGQWSYVASRKKLNPPRLVKMPDNQVIKMEWEYSAKPL